MCAIICEQVLPSFARQSRIASSSPNLQSNVGLEIRWEAIAKQRMRNFVVKSCMLLCHGCFKTDSLLANRVKAASITAMNSPLLPATSRVPSETVESKDKNTLVIFLFSQRLCIVNGQRLNLVQQTLARKGPQEFSCEPAARRKKTKTNMSSLS